MLRKRNLTIAAAVGIVLTCVSLPFLSETRADATRCVTDVHSVLCRLLSQAKGLLLPAR